MTEPLKILLLEDSATDAEIVHRLLKKSTGSGGEMPHFEFRLAMNKDAFLKELDQFQPDVILSDNSLPQFTGTEALEITRRRSLNTPFILVTGAISDEFAAGIIKSGADDYILKDRLARLPVAIDAALKNRKAEKEKQEAQQKLIQSESFIRGILSSLSSSVAVIDGDGIIITVNKAWENFAAENGVTTLERVSKGFNYFDVCNKAARAGDDIAAQAVKGIQSVLKRETKYFELQYPCHSPKEQRWFLMRAMPFENEKPMAVVSHNDITEIILSKIKLKESENRLNEAQHIAQIGSWELDHVSNNLLWSDEIYRIFEMDPGKFGVSYEAFLDAIHPDDREMVNKAYTDSVKNKTAYRIEHRILFPDGRIKIVKEKCENFYNEEGMPVRSAGIIQDITERKLADEKIRESEVRYRSLVEHASDGILVADLQGNILEVNSALCSMLGYTKEEVYNENVSEFIDPNDLKSNPIRFDLLQVGKSLLVERKAIHKNGNLFDIEVSTKMIGEDKLLSMIRDITERKKAEEKIRFNSILLNAIDQAVIATDINGTIIYWNVAAEKIYGWSSKEVLGRNIIDITPSSLSINEGTEIMKQLTQGKSWSGEYMVQRKGGSSFLAHVSDSPIYDSSGQLVAILGVSSDITEKKNAEENIRKSNERYEFVNKATHDTIWEWDFISKEGRWGEGIIKTFGYSKDKLIYKENWIDEYVHPSDRKEVRRKLQVCIESELENWQYEYRFICADGSHKYVYDRGFILYDEQGKPYRMIGAMTDVTEKKRLERELVDILVRKQQLITETTIRAQEQERNELGRELHDNINQILATVKMYLGMAKAKENIPLDLVDQSYEYVNEAMEELRKLSHSLVAPSLGDIGLKEALQGLVEDVNFLNSLQVQLLIDDKYFEKDIDENKELMFYRIVQEQMNNIVKYAKANKVVITLKTDDDKLILSIADNGVGFETTKKSKGIGLNNISNRVEFYSGSMDIISVPGQGCTLKVCIPC